MFFLAQPQIPGSTGSTTWRSKVYIQKIAPMDQLIKHPALLGTCNVENQNRRSLGSPMIYGDHLKTVSAQKFGKSGLSCKDLHDHNIFE